MNSGGLVRCALVLLLFFVVGCSSDDESRFGALESAPIAEAGPCLDGAVRRCSETLSSESGILSCFRGSQTCEGGTWGACEHGTTVDILDMRGQGSERDSLALSLPARCDFNPCDPGCQYFDENPPDITAMGGASSVTTTEGGTPPDWTSGSSTSPCAHSLCSEGDALEPSCHACVARVCDVDSSCCTDTGGIDWDAACVGLAYTECLGEPAQAPLPGENLCDYSAFGDRQVRFVNGGTYTGGILGSNGGTFPAVEVAGGATVDGIRAVGDLSVGGSSVVLGTATVSGTITNGGIIGDEEGGESVTTLSIPTRAIDCVAGDTSRTTLSSGVIPDGDTRVIRPASSGTPVFTFAAPGRFGGFDSYDRDARIVFAQPGTYSFSKFNLGTSSDFTIQVPNFGDVIIEVCGPSDAVSHVSPQLDFLGTLTLVTASGGTIAPHQLQLYTNFDQDIPFVPVAMQGFTIVAPYARVYSTGSAGSAYGMILADEVEFVTDVDFSSSGYTGDACVGAGILGPGVSVCPISLTTPPMPPIHDESCLMGDDCQVNSRCTDVATAPPCIHSKCVEGAALDTACRINDPCVERICDIDSSCCEQTEGWSCLPGNRCVAAECGDGLIRGLEECDDGNALSGDGCDSNCHVEPGYVCTGEASICVPTVCGDGVREGTETCDDGGLIPWDGCSETCTVEPNCPAQGGPCTSRCGDGMTLPADAEQCDDGNTNDGDGCSSTCQVEPGFSCAVGTGATASFIDLPVVYRDFANAGFAKHPDFEEFTGEGRTPGLVDTVLAVDGRPAYTGLCEDGTGFTASDCPTMGDWGGSASGAMTSGAGNFDEWYHPSGSSNAYWDTVRLNYSTAQSKYIFNAYGNFYPMSGRPWINGADGGQWSVGTSRNENFGFTTEMRHWFEYQGGEELYFHGDDDVWVFINGQLALDLGGAHPDLEASVTLTGTDACEEYTDWYGVTYPVTCRNLGLTIGQVYEIALFHADRHTDNSNFYLTLSGFFANPSDCDSVCGDGIVSADEVCDDGVNDGGSGECEAGCQSWDDTGITTGVWAGHCVEMVKTECDAFCGDVMISGCTHDACEMGEALGATCDDCASSVCGVRGYEHCCDSSSGSWDAACVRLASAACAEPGASACDWAVLSGGVVHVENMAMRGGLVGGDTRVEVSSDGTTDDIESYGRVTVSGGVTGDIVSDGSVSTSGGASTGAASAYETVERFGITERSFSCGDSGTTTVGSGDDVAIGPGTHQNIIVNDGGILRFGFAGDYYLQSLSMRGASTLILPDSGNVNLHICGNTEIYGDQADLSYIGPTMELASGATPSPADAVRFRFFINGTSEVQIYHRAILWGMFFAPHAQAYVGANARLYGVIHAAGQIWTNGGGTIDSTGVTGAACLAAGVVDAPSRSVHECDYALLSLGSSHVVGGTVIGGDVTAAGAVSVSPSSASCPPPTVGTCAYNPSVSDGVQVAGAFAGCSYVGGDCDFNLGVGHSVPSIATRVPSCPTGGSDEHISSSTTLVPGAYGAVTVDPGVSLMLTEGSYTVQSLTVGDGATIALPAVGRINLDVCDRVAIGNNVTTTGATSSADALRFQIYSASSDSSPLPNKADNAIYLGQGSTLFATLTAPAGGGVIDNWATLYGFLHVSEGKVLEGATIDATGVAGGSCLAQPQFGMCHALSDPGVPTTDGVGSCVDNEDGFVDSSCSGVDLAAGFGCDDYVPVCNHGATDAPAGVELTFFPRRGQQFSTMTPDPAWSIGTCTVTEPIPAGACVSQACGAGLTSAEATVMVNAGQALSECSYLDNWTLTDPAEVCPGTTGGATTTFTEVYEAVCPADSSPVFGLLTWSSQTPGSSEISFEGRLAGSIAGLSSEVFEPLGTAQVAPADTQICSYLSALPSCPVDIPSQLSPLGTTTSMTTSAMSGELESVSVFELQVSLNPSAPDLPVLEDWEITYSCLVDQ